MVKEVTDLSHHKSSKRPTGLQPKCSASKSNLRPLFYLVPEEAAVAKSGSGKSPFQTHRKLGRHVLFLGETKKRSHYIFYNSFNYTPGDPQRPIN